MSEPLRNKICKDDGCSCAMFYLNDVKSACEFYKNIKIIKIIL